MLQFAIEGFRTTLLKIHTTMSTREVERRVRQHVDAIRERLR